MGRTLSKAKGRRSKGTFAALPHAVLESPKYAALPPRAVKALLDLYAQFRGVNNGDLKAARSVMQPRGWRSKNSLYLPATANKPPGPKIYPNC